MTLESNLNPNDIDPPPRIMGSLVLIHAVSGLCCGVFGLIQMAQPDFFATQFVPGYEGPDVPPAIKLVGILAMASKMTSKGKGAMARMPTNLIACGTSGPSYPGTNWVAKKSG